MKKTQLPTIKITGKRDNAFSHYLSAQAIKALNLERSPPHLQKETLGALRSLFKSFQPTSEIEAMLLVQLFTNHNFSMELMHKAQTEKHWHTIDTTMNYANKFSKNFMMLLEALDKHRNPSSEK